MNALIQSAQSADPITLMVVAIIAILVLGFLCKLWRDLDVPAWVALAFIAMTCAAVWVTVEMAGKALL